MSRRNGDRSRFHINQKRKLLRRQRVQAMLTAFLTLRESRAASSVPGAQATSAPDAPAQ